MAGWYHLAAMLMNGLNTLTKIGCNINWYGDNGLEEEWCE